jgi:hypothetical protein
MSVFHIFAEGFLSGEKFADNGMEFYTVGCPEALTQFNLPNQGRIGHREFGLASFCRALEPTPRLALSKPKICCHCF